MSLKRYIVYPLAILLLILISGAGTLVLTDYLLPGLLETRITSILKKDAGISEIALKLRRVGLDGADLGPFRLGSAQNPALVIQSIRVDYAPEELYQGKVKNIVASGVELHTEFKNGKPGLRGFDLAELLDRIGAPSTQHDADVDHSFSALPMRIEIKSGALFCEINGQVHRIPFEMVMTKDAGDASILDALVDLYPRGQEVKISVRADLAQHQLSTKLMAGRLSLSRFTDLFESVDGLHVTGTADLEANSDFTLDPFSISDVHGRLKGSAFTIDYNGLQFRTLSDQKQNEIPLVIDFEKTSGPDWRIHLSDFETEAPFAARIADMAATVQPKTDRYEISGNLKLSLEPSGAALDKAIPIRLTEPFELPLEFSGRYSKSGSWQFGLTSRDSQKSEHKNPGVDLGEFHVATRLPTIAISGGSRDGTMSATYKLQVPGVQASSESVKLLLPQLVLTGEATIGGEGARGITSTVNLELSGGKLTSNAFQMEAGDLSAVCTLQIDDGGVRQVDGRVKFDGGRLTDTRKTYEFSKIKGDIPLRFPVTPSAKKGRIEIESARYNTLKVGAINADLQQTASGLSFSGNLKSPLMPDLAAKFSGDTHLWPPGDNETRAHFEMVYPETGPEIDLARLMPAAEGFTFKGKLVEAGDLVIGKEGIKVASETHISGGTLAQSQNKVSIDGIQMDLSIPDLVEMRSAPGEKLKFSQASFGEMKIENGEIDYQIESPQSLLVEKSRFTWCDGNVETPAIRLTSGTKDYRLILYCDRLNLAKVLGQFGATTERAEGQLNGRIPVRYRNGQLSFSDGFLYTTPGETGKIRMTDTEMLTAGIPPDTPQYVQMELARKALEDYDYSWAKLNLTTEGEDLVLKMQLDGKPAQSLPFVYQKDLGGFAKVEANVQGSKFQEIRLDVNFRLPLNKLMQYKGLIQMIQKSGD